MNEECNDHNKRNKKSWVWQKRGNIFLCVVFGNVVLNNEGFYVGCSWQVEGVTDLFFRNWTVIKNILHMLSYSELLVNIADT